MSKKVNSHVFEGLSDIELMLDSYDDIFSDFDPRPYSLRSLSVDFLDAAERASLDKNNDIALNLRVPKRSKDRSKERLIIGRLKHHFQKHLTSVSNERKKLHKFGMLMISSGIICMFLATLIMHFDHDSLLSSFMIVVFEPAGWFLFWEGLYQIFFKAEELNPKLNFYSKMHKSGIKFFTY